MKDDFTIIEGKAELLPFIKELWQQLNEHHQSSTKYFKARYQEMTFENRTSSLKTKAEEGDIQVLLAKEDGAEHYIGYCVNTINAEGSGEVDSLYVEQAYRGTGLGDLLMRQSLTWLESKQAKEIVLTVAGGNEKVLDFYKRYGFYTTAVKLAKVAELPQIESFQYKDYIISTDKSLIQLDKVCAMLQGSYWAEGRSKEKIKISMDNSLCFGVYDGQKQIGLARVVTDYAVFAYLCDVIVDKDYRGKGIGVALMEYVFAYPKLQGISGWSLLTKDAHGLYEKFGFARPEEPGRLMRKTLK